MHYGGQMWPRLDIGGFFCIYLVDVFIKICSQTLFNHVKSVVLASRLPVPKPEKGKN